MSTYWGLFTLMGGAVRSAICGFMAGTTQPAELASALIALKLS